MGLLFLDLIIALYYVTPIISATGGEIPAEVVTTGELPCPEWLAFVCGTFYPQCTAENINFPCPDVCPAGMAQLFFSLMNAALHSCWYQLGVDLNNPSPAVQCSLGDDAFKQIENTFCGYLNMTTALQENPDVYTCTNGKRAIQFF